MPLSRLLSAESLLCFTSLLPAELSMFGSRLFISAAFSLLWVFTPSHFPTRVRGFGLGISNASGRCDLLWHAPCMPHMCLLLGEAAADTASSRVGVAPSLVPAL